MGGGNYTVNCSWLDNLLVKVNEIRLTFPSNVFINLDDLTSFDDVFNYSCNYNNPQIRFTTTAEICSNEKTQSRIITYFETEFIDDNYLNFMPKAYGAESYAHTFGFEIVWDNIVDIYDRRGKLIWEKNYDNLMLPIDSYDMLELDSFCMEGKFYLSRGDVYFLPIYWSEQYLIN